MGKTVTPKYRVRAFDQNGGFVASWQGRPSDERLREYIESYTASLKIGGVNERISKSLGYIPVPSRAQIETNVKGQGTIVATWQAPMFWVF
jgi:hypothetical protein